MKRLIIVAFVLFMVISFYGLVSAQSDVPNQSIPDSEIQGLIDKVDTEGSVRVLVRLNLPNNFMPEGSLPNSEAVQAQRDAIDQIGQSLIQSLGDAHVYATYDSVPYIALIADKPQLAFLQESSLVAMIQEDKLLSPTLDSSTAVIGMPAVWAAGHDGSDQTVVILDTGIEADHPFFGGRVVAEACFSNGAGGGVSLCPNGSTTQTGSGAAAVNTSACGNLCSHGTHVAGIAAGDGADFDGVARGANIIAIQIFTRFNNSNQCNGNAPCVRTYNSDQISALEYVNDTLANSYDIASVNMSLGGGRYTSTCDNEVQKPAIDNLRANNIATVIATGNNSYTNAISAPACISSAIAVGSTTDNDAISSFSNHSDLVDLLAPGSAINSSVPNGGFDSYNGTSMATPHVAGAWAVLKSINPSATVDDILDLLVSTGVDVTDTRLGSQNITKPRIAVDEAVSSDPSTPAPTSPPPTATTTNTPPTATSQPPTATAPPPGGNELQNGVPLTNLSGDFGSQTHYTMVVPAGAENLTFEMSGGSGNANLYVKYGSQASFFDYDCQSYNYGNNETCTITNIQAGTYYVMVHGSYAYSGVTLVGSYTSPGPTSSTAP